MTTRSLFIGLLLFSFSGILRAAPVPHTLFSDHMVLQRDRAIPVWGTAEPGEMVTVSLSSGVRATSAADAQGRWKAMLPALHAGGPFTMRIEGRGGAVVLRDVMIGEVWVLSGQSNMTYELERASNSGEAIASANRPDIRLFTVARNGALEPQAQPDGKWEECTPDSAKSFSAVAYFFGMELTKRLHVPVGLIHSSWPGSSGEEWVDRRSLEQEAAFAPILKRWQNAPESARAAAGQGLPFALEFSDFVLKAQNGAGKTLSEFHGGGTQDAFGGAWNYTWHEAPLTSFELVPSGQAGYVARVSGRLRDEDNATLHLNFAPGEKPIDLTSYTALAFRVRGNGFYQVQFLQPTISDGANYSSSVLHGTGEWQTVELPFANLKQPDWGVQTAWSPNALTGINFENLTMDTEYQQRPPAGLYNGMVAPLVPFAVRGVVWYQGESNALRAYQYRKLLPALMESWRTAWQSPDLFFLIVQLPNHGPAATAPQESAWAEMREAQRIAAQLPHTALAVTIDLGQQNNVHPPDKADVGARLALAAAAEVYGQPVEGSGPIYDSAKADGKAIRIHFRGESDELRTTDGKSLRGFAIAGADRRFVWADARVEGKEVVVTSPAISDPQAVRYDWADSPDGNLTNASGIPASPFRTDDWPGITAANE